MSWLLCDFGNVLARGQSDAARKALIEMSGISAQDFITTYWAHRLPYDANLTATDYWAQATGKAPDSDHVQQLVALDIESWMTPFPGSTDAVLRAAERGFRLALFSNAPVECGEPIRTAPWLPKFEHYFFSFDIGAKPDPTAYDKVRSELGCEFSDITFIDDRPENVAGANALGINAIQFYEAAQIDDLVPQQN